MLKRIYEELVLIRKELQAIRNNLGIQNESGISSGIRWAVETSVNNAKKEGEIGIKVDETIKTISENIVAEKVSFDEYADTVKALAALVEARGKLN